MIKNADNVYLSVAGFFAIPKNVIFSFDFSTRISIFADNTVENIHSL